MDEAEEKAKVWLITKYGSLEKAAEAWSHSHISILRMKGYTLAENKLLWAYRNATIKKAKEKREAKNEST